MAMPEDNFTQPEDVDPDMLVEVKPLGRLAEVWEGLKCVHINPKANEHERREFLEHIELQPTDPQADGPQSLRPCRE